MSNKTYLHQVIDHQQQPTPDSCVSTCLAMAINLPAQQVINDLHDDYKSGKSNPIEYCRERDIPYEILPPYSAVEDPGCYLLIVPSLNIHAGMHQIFYVVEESDSGGFFHTLYDPVRGRTEELPDGNIIEKKYYISNFDRDDKSPLATQLKGYSIDLKFPIEFVRARYDLE